MRIDKFLKVSRILKRRSVAKDAGDGGRIKINGNLAKPSKEVKVGDEIELMFNSGSVKFKVLNIKETVKKEEAETLYEILGE
jgi:ribosomal 50S subunit-recycling heat shock protein